MSGEGDHGAALPQIDERGRRAVAAAQEWVGDGIEGVGLGSTESGEPALVVFVSDRSADAVKALPTECEGLPVIAVDTGAFSAGG